MARKARQRISYVLPLADSAGGHRLGVNGLATDKSRAALYTGGRDGVICAWDVDAPPRTDEGDKLQVSSAQPSNRSSTHSTIQHPNKSLLRRHVQAHTHWVNDIVLTKDGAGLVSASSDLTVKLWRPYAEDHSAPQTLGLHTDYVKCVASPGYQADWVASGGLDRRICLWDLNGQGERLQIDVGNEVGNAKGSVYALAVGGGVIASGGPESIVRLWDPRTGKRVTKLVGHTDNVRDILISATGDTIMTASSDQTVKVWSVAAGRCMYTFTMHNDSVWSLHSSHPQLSVFYSADRSGLIARTDVRGTTEMDDGLCLAICQEHEGVNKVIESDGYLWTATSSSSINRWLDLDQENETRLSSYQHHYRASSNASRAKSPTSPRWTSFSSAGAIPLKRNSMQSILRLSNGALFPISQFYEAELSNSSNFSRKPSDPVADSESGGVVPLNDVPQYTIEGQHGLIKHVLLNDRRRVLTLDTAGEVVLWDLIQCTPIQKFGKRRLDDVVPELTTTDTIANWCAVDTRTGSLACVLEDNYCFDGELYADELGLDESFKFWDDQRINMGKWVLRYLFSNLINEEIERDEQHRKSLEQNGEKQAGSQKKGPGAIQIPPPGWQNSSSIKEDMDTPRANNSNGSGLVTPGLAIGAITPSSSSHGATTEVQIPQTSEDGSTLEKTGTQRNDYFFPGPPAAGAPTAESNGKTTSSTTVNGSEGSEAATAATTNNDGEKETQQKESTRLFSKKFRMPFGGKKAGRTSFETKPVSAEEKGDDSDNETKSTDTRSSAVDDSFYGTIQKIRLEYNTANTANPQAAVSTAIKPSLPGETPVVRPPSETIILIQEDRPESGGISDLYRGTVGSVGRDADVIEKVAPMWLGDLLLKNQIPLKEIVKVSFVLNPYQDLLPSVSGSEINARLNANRMLRAKKILAYAAERLEAKQDPPDPDALKPEQYLELYCQNQLIPNNMTLATIRSHVWKTGGDVFLYYKSNGKKKILGEVSPEEAVKPDSPDALGLSGTTAVNTVLASIT